MSIVKKFGYKNYIGDYLPRHYRIWQICLFNLRERIWNQKSVIVTFTILMFLSIIIVIPIAFISSSGSGFFTQFLQNQNVDLDSLFNNFLAQINYILITNPLTFILFGLIGGKIISEDIEYKSLEQYFLRIRRSDYIIGKFSALFLSYFLPMLLISFIFYYFLTSAFGFGLLSTNSTISFIRIVVFLLIITITCTLFMLALSSATEKKNYATLIFILIFLATGNIFQLFSIFLHSDFYLLFYPQELIGAILKGIVPLSSQNNPLGLFLAFSGNEIRSSVQFTESLGMAILTSVLSIIYLFKKINTIWS